MLLALTVITWLSASTQHPVWKMFSMDQKSLLHCSLDDGFDFFTCRVTHLPHGSQKHFSLAEFSTDLPQRMTPSANPTVSRTDPSSDFSSADPRSTSDRCIRKEPLPVEWVHRRHSVTSEAPAENYQRKQKGFFSSKPSPLFFLVNFSIDNESWALFPNVGPVKT